MKPSLKIPKPRNPLVAPCPQRKAGAHRSSGGARRQQDRVALRREVEDLRPSP